MEIYIFISAVVFLLILELFIVFRRKRFSKRDLKFLRGEWESIRAKLDREPKHALIEADKLLDFALARRGFTGSLGEKLKRAKKFFNNNDDLWAAHKLRNRAVHEVGFDITEHEARKALSVYKQALWHLGIKIQ